MEFVEAILYSDDGICVKYEDGSVLQLSPCSSTFRYQESEILSRYPTRPYFQQLTRFTVSSLRRKVICAVNLRNQYASRPYLCKELLNQDLFSIECNEVSECTWPQTLSSEYITQKDSGNIIVQSLDGFARLELRSHKQTFCVSYLAKVAQEMGSQSKQKSKGCIQYLWVDLADESTQNCPQIWMYPLKLALEKSQDKIHVSRELLALSNVSKFPKTLPVSCNYSHLHSWTLKDQLFTGNDKEEIFWQPNMKIVWTNSMIYRVYRNKECMLKVEIDPGDNTVFISSGLTGTFFNHFDIKGTEGKMYRADKSTPDLSGMKYSVAKILRQGSRLFNFILTIGLQSEPCICWQSQDTKVNTTSQAEPLFISETATVPDIGKFVAYSNGHLYVAFADRTLLNVKYTSGIDNLWFNCTLPSGQVLQGYPGNMPQLARYIKMACEWGDWVTSSPQQRKTFYKDTMWNLDQQRFVEAEISKLRRFNYILDHGLLNVAHQAEIKPHIVHMEEHNKQTAYPHNLPNIDMALQSTTIAIRNIENFLSTSKTTT